MESSNLLLKVMIAFAQPPFQLDLDFSNIIGKNNAFSASEPERPKPIFPVIYPWC